MPSAGVFSGDHPYILLGSIVLTHMLYSREVKMNTGAGNVKYAKFRTAGYFRNSSVGLCLDS